MKANVIIVAVASFSAAAIAAAAPASAPASAPPPGHPSVPAAPNAARAAALPLQGKVVSVIDSGGYTYVEVAQGGNTMWIAGPPVTLTKGSTIRFDEGAMMKNFHSKTLDRTFPSVLFVGAIVDAGRIEDTKPRHKGRAVSVIQSGGYTYVEARQGDRTQWIAAPGSTVEKNDVIRFDDGAVMADFYSKSLNRTFPRIMFVPAVQRTNEKE